MSEETGYTPPAPARAGVARVPQSGHGIASFVISLVASVAIMLCVAVSGLMVATGHTDEDTLAFGVIGLTMFVFLLLAVAGVVLGIIGVRRRDRRRTFAAIGLSLNILILVGTAALVALGSLVN
ncbi:hypothetical protein EC912_101337 [Luteibacter rhizovicinus]|uniref:Uncharacterized protein n=1 Tax=Luteibacter rhizovicinus TaxID=242606 RepID=A0A4R3YW78_9GAMM|nr:hypothetical protein [Luteibacter rhizovicinus]TCV97337.1 hypothetical protein EC912_101337 [Luteibacter rhizovicinus]